MAFEGEFDVNEFQKNYKPQILRPPAGWGSQSNDNQIHNDSSNSNNSEKTTAFEISNKKPENCTLDDIEAMVEQEKFMEQRELITFKQLAVIVPLGIGNEQGPSHHLTRFSSASTHEFNASSSNDCPDLVTFKHANNGVSQKRNILPNKSIAYDMTREPLAVLEQRREYLPLIGELSSPLLRPIVIDGIGLIKSYWEVCSEDDEDAGIGYDRIFPMVPIVRALFYWVSRGHKAVICFPLEFSPISNRDEFLTEQEDIRSLSLLQHLGLTQFFETNEKNSIDWFLEKCDSERACLITSVSHYGSGMPSNLTLDHDYIPYDRVASCPNTILQPYFASKANFVFFCPIVRERDSVARRGFISETVLDNDIKSEEEFNRLEKYQLNFIDQVKQLKILYGILEGQNKSRVREAKVMVDLLKRIGRKLF